MFHLQNDVLMAKEVLQSSTDECKSCEFCLLYSYSKSSFTRKAGLKSTEIKLDYVTKDKFRLPLKKIWEVALHR